MSRICGDAAGMVCDDGGHLAGGGGRLPVLARPPPPPPPSPFCLFAFQLRSIRRRPGARIAFPRSLVRRSFP